MEKLEKKYIDLLLLKCVNFEKSKSLFISYDEENISFINKLVERATELGVYDVCLYADNKKEKHDVLKRIPYKQVDTHPAFNRRIWDEYALKGASFLVLESEHPGLMDDVDPEKVARARYIERVTRPIYKRLQLEFRIPWCMGVLPSKDWAKSLFPELSEQESYDKLFTLICEMCMVNTNNPMESWDKFLIEQRQIEKKLNDLQISKMHYKNALGTDLEVEITPNTNWGSIGSLGENMMVNLPSYEIFTNPNYKKTNGIVYSSRPLYYNGGIVDEFYLEFENGKVVNYDAKKGMELLKGIINSDQYTSYLGEVALVNHDSPISNTGLVYGNTTLDENASCHLALGSGFPECVIDSDMMTVQEMSDFGINPSKNHVDFMIGTSDLQIEADTKEGKKLVLKNGNFNL